MRRAVAALAGLLVLLLVSACGPHSVGSFAPPSDVAVDTPALVAQKKAAGIGTCKPGPGGGSLPAVTLPCLGGGPSVDLSSLKGPMIINLWASNCTPCRKEMPALQQFYSSYGKQVPVLGVDVEAYPAAALGFAQSTGAKYPQLADPGGSIYDQKTLYLTQALPTSLLIDADGKLVGNPVVGSLGSYDDIKQLVQQRLGVTL